MTNEERDFFNELYQVNVNELTEEKNGLTYLSWAYAIAEICKRYNQTFDYEIKKFGEKQLPYVYDEGIGFMVFTSVTLNGKTRECWLPVMDSSNRAMLKEPYVIKTSSGKEIHIASATMFDVNKTIMRCLTKNLAIFGLGLYLYAGEDVPEIIEESITNEQIKEIQELVSADKMQNMLKWAKVQKIEDMTKKQAEVIIAGKKKSIEENK